MSDSTPQPEITAIAAVARNGVIGAGQGIPWRLDGDFPRVKRLTMGGVLVMGRRTFDSIGRPLPGRENFVVTRDESWSASGTTVFHDVDAALDAAVATGLPVWVFGGGEIYRQAWARTTRLEITHVDQEPAGDVTFPVIDPQDWRVTAREEREGFRWVSYARGPASASVPDEISPA